MTKINSNQTPPRRFTSKKLLERLETIGAELTEARATIKKRQKINNEKVKEWKEREKFGLNPAAGRRSNYSGPN